MVVSLTLNDGTPATRLTGSDSTGSEPGESHPMKSCGMDWFDCSSIERQAIYAERRPAPECLKNATRPGIIAPFMARTLSAQGCQKAPELLPRVPGNPLGAPCRTRRD